MQQCIRVDEIGNTMESVSTSSEASQGLGNGLLNSNQSLVMSALSLSSNHHGGSANEVIDFTQQSLLLSMVSSLSLASNSYLLYLQDWVILFLYLCIKETVKQLL